MLEKLNRLAKRVMEEQRREYAIEVMLGDRDGAKEIMDKCREIATHFVQPNHETAKECAIISHNLAAYGDTLDVILEKLDTFGSLRLALLRVWGLIGFNARAEYTHSFEAFAFQKLKVIEEE